MLKFEALNNIVAFVWRIGGSPRAVISQQRGRQSGWNATVWYPATLVVWVGSSLQLRNNDARGFVTQKGGVFD
jgi:hypothetical protein